MYHDDSHILICCLLFWGPVLALLIMLRGTETPKEPATEATTVIIEMAEVVKSVSHSDVQETILLDGSVDVVQEDGMLAESGKATTKKTIIGEDRRGKKYTVSKLCGKRVLLCDKRNDKCIYFLGVLNENGNWDSCCITNVYSSDGVLLGACQACYDDGKRVRYRSFEAFDDKSQWAYIKYETGYDREDRKPICRVETYEYASDIVMTFKADNMQATDILTVHDDLLTMPLMIKSFYVGKLTDNRYNDETGSACLVKYDNSGFVKCLYQGCFKNGDTVDDTGNAYVIHWSSDRCCYLCYNGKFASNNAFGTFNWKEITVQDIQRTLKNKQWARWLRWLSV